MRIHLSVSNDADPAGVVLSVSTSVPETARESFLRACGEMYDREVEKLADNLLRGMAGDGYATLRMSVRVSLTTD